MGMDIYMMGSYSSDSPDPQLAQRVRNALALQRAGEITETAKVEAMVPVTVAGVEAMYFTCPTQRTGGVWHQWVFVKNNQAFVIVSAMEKAKEPTRLPVVMEMVKSFRLVGEAGTSGRP
jgi:hypothetical protein